MRRAPREEPFVVLAPARASLDFGRMEVSVKYGCITMTPPPKIAVPLSAAIDDALALSIDSSYLTHLAAS